jgi:hypothetical protein
MWQLVARLKMIVARSGERIMYRGLLFVSMSAAAVSTGMDHGTVIAAPPGNENRRDVVVLRHCDLDYEQSTLVSGHSGTGMALPLQDSLVRLGDHVNAGQVIGRIFDRDLQVQVALRRAESESDIDVRLAESKRNESALKLKRIEKLRRNAQPYVSVRRSRPKLEFARSSRLTTDSSLMFTKSPAKQCLQANPCSKLSRPIVFAPQPTRT